MAYNPNNPNGSATSANSAPVVIASDQATVPVSLASVPSHPVTGPLTDAQLRATPVPVSGTVITGGLTDTQLRASAVPISLDTAPTTPVTFTGSTDVATQTTLATRLAESTFTTRIPVQGQATMAASIPVTIASNQSTLPISAASLPLPTGAALDATLIGGTQQTKLTDGTNIANILKSDGTAAGNNAQLVAPTVLQLSFTTSTPGAQTLLANTDVSHYTYVEIVYTSVGTGLALTGQWSTASGGTYITQNSWGAGPNSVLTSALGIATGIVYRSPVQGNFFQLVLSALTSGTVTGTLTLRTGSMLHGLQSVTGTVSVSGYPTAAASADALANPTVTQIGTTNLSFNGTSWDRQRGMSVATTTGDTGAKVATGNGATQTNVGNKGVQIVLAMGVVSGTTPTFVLKIQGSVDAGTTWYDIPGATTASLVATGTWGITIYPGVTVTAGTTTTGTTATANQILPRTWRTLWTIGGTTPSFTITSITYNYIPN